MEILGVVKQFLSEIGANLASAIAGLFGASLSAFQGKERTRKERLVNFGIGFACALFLPGVIVSYFNLTPKPEFFSALGFVLGYFGMTISDAVIRFDWRTIAESWLKKGG